MKNIFQLSVRLSIIFVYIFFIGLSVWNPSRFQQLTHLYGISWGQEPFYDSFAPLSWLECAQRGFNIYVTNPCDTRGSFPFPITYPPSWMLFNIPGLDTRYTEVVGIVWGLLFVVAVALLPLPRSIPGLLFHLLCTLSNAVAFALYQGNFDLVIFAGLTFATLWPRPTRGARTAFAVLVASLTILKLYPIAALSGMARERLGQAAVSAGCVLLAVGIFVVTSWQGILHAVRMVPSTSVIDMFGAANLQKGLAVLLPGLADQRQGVVIIVTVAAILLGLTSFRAVSAALPRIALAPRERFAFLIGAALIVFCFFAGVSFRYRAIFLLLTLAPLCSLARTPGAWSLRLICMLALAGIGFLLWGFFALSAFDHFAKMIAHTDVPPQTVLRGLLWLLREGVWWSVIAVLAGFLARLLLEEPAVLDLRAWAAKAGKARA